MKIYLILTIALLTSSGCAVTGTMLRGYGRGLSNAGRQGDTYRCYHNGPYSTCERD